MTYWGQQSQEQKPALWLPSVVVLASSLTLPWIQLQEEDPIDTDSHSKHQARSVAGKCPEAVTSSQPWTALETSKEALHWHSMAGA